MAGYCLWLQNAAYPARYDRQLISEVFGGREFVLRGLVVSQDGGGTQNVSVSGGAAVIVGDDEPNQGMGLAVFDADELVPMPVPPGTPGDSRIDLVIVQMNDPQAGGPAGDNATLAVVEGTPAASDPSVPATPNSAVAIAQVLRTSSEGGILTAAITSIGPRGTFPYTVSTSPVPATLPAGHLYVRVQ